MSNKKLKFDNVVVNKEDFHASEQAITLDLVNLKQLL